jgi:hypothetical protein
MTPYEMAVQAYAKVPGLDFAADMSMHLRYGYVLSTPSCLILARPVRRDWPREFIASADTVAIDPDCWFIWLMCGSLKEAARHLPYPLPWFGFSQRGEPARFVDAEKVLAKLA